MPTFEPQVVVVGTGARTAVGWVASATAAAIRAGISGFGEHPFMVDTAGKRILVAMAPYVDKDPFGARRLAELAGPAAMEAVLPLASVARQNPRVPMFMGLPPNRPGRAKDLGVVVNRVLDEVSSAGLLTDKLTLIETGHAAGAMAIQLAWEKIRSGTTEFALAGAVDSYLAPETLEWLEANDQLHSAGPENNAHGFVPGEAGGFVLFSTATAAARYQLPAFTELVGTATAREKKLIKTSEVCLGEGLSDLFRALSRLPSVNPVDHLYCDMNGEPYRADEFGFSTLRAGEIFRDPSAFTAPADCWGDVGAASGPLFMLLADSAIRKAYAPGAVLAAFTSSESGERSGFVVQARDQGMR